MCERTLWERVRTDGGVGSAMSTLALVNSHDSCRELQDLCIGYVADDWEAATAMEEYRELKTTCPALLSDVLEDVITKQLLLSPSSDSGVAATHHQKSASVYRPSEVWRGKHQFTVLGHSVVLRTHGNGGFIYSGAFDVGGHEWRILYYPSGYNEEHDGQVFLQLQTSLDPDVVLEASGTITVVDGRGRSSADNSELERDGENDFCSQDHFWHRYTNNEPAAEGCSSRKLSMSCLVGPDDSLTVECSFEFQVVVAGANKTTTTTTASLPAKELDMVVPPPSISWHLERLLESGVGSDVAFSVDGSEFHAHTLVLNKRASALLSKTWAEVVKGSKKKKKDRTMMFCIDGIKAVVFKALLHFVYTDELPPMDDLLRAAESMPEPASPGTTRLAGDLLAPAERYHLVERMRPLCENLLCEVITPENAAATLEVARRHGRPELRAFCLDYMTSPGVLKAVVASQGYQVLFPDAVQDIVAHLAH